MFIPQFFLLEYLLVLFIVKFLENIFETAIVFLQNCVFGGEVERVVALESILEAALGKGVDALVCVIHCHSDSSFSLVVVYFSRLLFSTFTFESDGESARLVDGEISSFVLVSEGVSAYDYRLFPSRDQSGDVFDDNRFSEDGTI